MSTNKSIKHPITPARRRQLAIGRILTNIRQLLTLDPSDENIALIEQHTALLTTLYRHHAALSAKEAGVNQPTDTTSEEEITPLNNVDAETSPRIKSACSTPTAPEQSTDLNSMVRIPRKLKKKLAKLPDNHPLRLRYNAIFHTPAPQFISPANKQMKKSARTETIPADTENLSCLTRIRT